jgi:hypothetical protein
MALNDIGRMMNRSAFLAVVVARFLPTGYFELYKISPIEPGAQLESYNMP